MAVPVGCRSCLQMSFHQMMRMWMRTMATMRQRIRLKTEMKEEWENCWRRLARSTMKRLRQRLVKRKTRKSQTQSIGLKEVSGCSASAPASCCASPAPGQASGRLLKRETRRRSNWSLVKNSMQALPRRSRNSGSTVDPCFPLSCKRILHFLLLESCKMVWILPQMVCMRAWNLKRVCKRVCGPWEPSSYTRALEPHSLAWVSAHPQAESS